MILSEKLVIVASVSVPSTRPTSRLEGAGNGSCLTLLSAMLMCIKRRLSGAKGTDLGGIRNDSGACLLKRPPPVIKPARMGQGPAEPASQYCADLRWGTCSINSHCMLPWCRYGYILAVLGMKLVKVEHRRHQALSPRYTPGITVDQLEQEVLKKDAPSTVCIHEDTHDMDTEEKSGSLFPLKTVAK